MGNSGHHDQLWFVLQHLLSAVGEWWVDGEPGAFCRGCWEVEVGMWPRVYFGGRAEGSHVQSEIERQRSLEKIPPTLLTCSLEQSVTSLCPWLLFAIATSEMWCDLV